MELLVIAAIGLVPLVVGAVVLFLVLHKSKGEGEGGPRR
jgi:hypothetical protein